jgi:quercetin dioxygenase-like cupin family protein
MHAVRTPLAGGALVFAIGAFALSTIGAQTAPKTPPAHTGHHVVSGKDITWRPASGALPGGVEMAVLQGDPAKEGPFVLRLKFPDAQRVPPHWHPSDEHVTVIEGTFMLGTGEKFDVAGTKPLAAGDYAFMPKEMRHFAMTKGASIVQVQGTGPFVVNYVNPADDPRNKKTTSQ